MLNVSAASIIACPSCREDLFREENVLKCTRCQTIYPITDGIPRLYSPSNRLTIDPRELRIKTRVDAVRTINEMGALDTGLIKNTRAFVLAYCFLIIFLVTGFHIGTTLIAIGLLVDWVTLRRKRSKTLSQYLQNPLRLRTAADHQSIDEMYRREGKKQPTMTDWVQLSREASGTEALKGNRNTQDDERYLDILKVYRERPLPADVVVDVGANDGRAYYEFGIGREKTFIGIDVSYLLLKQFTEKIPDQTALQADGTCLPLKDNSVDFLFCSETLEHLTDPDEAIHEFLRVLKPGGCLMIQSPNAHRIRNLNIFHIITLFTSLFMDRTLQKKMVHENTWHNATTYHWDFSIQDYQRMIRDRGARILELRSSGFYFPEFLLHERRDLFRMKERFFRSIPFVRFLGRDLVMVVEKEAIQPAVDPLTLRVPNSARDLAQKPC